MKKLILNVAALFLLQISFGQSLKEGVALMNGDNIAAAKKSFQAVLNQDPKSAGAWFYLGEIFYMSDNVDSAYVCYAKALEVNPESYFSHVGAGKMLLDKNKKADADKAFMKARKAVKEKELPEVLALIGSAYLNSRYPNKEKAAAAYLEARDMDPKNAQYFVGYGDVLLAQDKIGDALANYELAANKDKENPEILMKIARAYSKNGIADVAIEQLEGGIAKFPNYAPAYKELYQLYFQKGQYTKGTPLLEKYVNLVGNDVEQRARLVKFLCYLAKDYPKTIAEANIVLQQQPNNYVMYRWLAWAYFESGNYQASLDSSIKFFEMVGDRPVYASDYEYYAKAAAKLNNLPVAAENFRKVVALDSTRTDVYEAIAKSYYESKQWPAAETAYAEKIAKGKPNIQDWYYFGMSLYYQNKNVEADSAFAKLTELQPTYATGWLMRARSNNRIDPDRKAFLAKPYFEKYVELASKDVEKNKKPLIEAYNYIGYYFSTIDDFVGSLSWYEKTLGLDAENEEAKNAVQQLKAVMGGK